MKKKILGTNYYYIKTEPSLFDLVSDQERKGLQILLSYNIISEKFRYDELHDIFRNNVKAALKLASLFVDGDGYSRDEIMERLKHIEMNDRTTMITLLNKLIAQGMIILHNKRYYRS